MLARVDLPVDVTIGVVLDDAVFFAGRFGPTSVVVDRETWEVSTTDLGRSTESGTVETDGTSIFVPDGEQDVVVVDATTFAPTDDLTTMGSHSVTLADGSLWVAGGDALAQRFELGG